jgi:hypothetical protein
MAALVPKAAKPVSSVRRCSDKASGLFMADQIGRIDLDRKPPFLSSAQEFLTKLGPMPRRLPPLNALKSFESAARYESFTRAAEELCVTQAAVSQQVKALEAELGFKLFNRERQRLKMTEAGRDYLMVI